MKIRYSIFFFLFLSTLVANSQKRYYEFGWRKLYGIVDSAGNEIIPPTYQWKVYTLGEQSPFIALNSHGNGGLIINTSTGGKERLKYLDDTYLLDIGNEEYMYAYNGVNAFLINNVDLTKRKILPHIYVELRQAGDFLLGYWGTDAEENNVDILSKGDCNVVSRNQRIHKISHYKTAVGKSVYVIRQKNKTVFLDDQLKQRAMTTKELEDFESVQKYFLSVLKIEIVEESYPIETAEEAPPPTPPYIDAQIEGDRISYGIYQSKKVFLPFFQFQWDSSGKFRLYNDSYSNKVEVRRKEGQNRELYFMFNTDVIRKKVLLPLKYWKEIGLQMTSE